ncbi:sugar transferase [Wenyingzhuangia sp.]|uniref:sugar transferase n=1 Tax=Wenyingzhuangia sp. TaxID=1964193 RepID=UPI0032190044
MITTRQFFVKRVMDLTLASLGLIVTIPLMLLLVLVVYVFVGENGLFVQKRIGQYGEEFNIIKIRSLYAKKEFLSFSCFLRKSKLDELPQLWNVLVGEMSMVGPRPDLEGFADKLKGEDRIVLVVKPGITGPASLYFYDEARFFNNVKKNKEVTEKLLWKKKIKINKKYIKEYSLKKDIGYVFKTLLLVLINLKNNPSV